MKCCCNRYTFGITIGSLYIVGSIIVMILSIITYVHLDELVEDPERGEYLKSEAIETIIICFIKVLISSLYIVGIVKKYHYLILPFLILGIYVFYFTCYTLYWWFIGAEMGGASGITMLILLLIAVLSLGIEIAIFCFSISLFKQIQAGNKSEKIRADHQLADKSLI